MSFVNRSIYILLFLFVLFPFPLNAEDQAIKVEISEGKAQVTVLDGSASVVKADTTQSIALSKGDFLDKGDRIVTGKKSRMEIKLPDGSYLRFDELSTFELQAVAFNEKTKMRNISVRMVLGKTWAKVSKFFNRKGFFAISSKTAVAGVRGTDFRMNVNNDDSAILKVYSGEVAVSSPPKAMAAPTSGKFTEPSPVSGPHPVDGPKPVSMQEWTHIVQSMQQIIIKPDGTSTKPFRFTVDADMNDWVRWNQVLDKKIEGEKPIKE